MLSVVFCKASAQTTSRPGREVRVPRTASVREDSSHWIKLLVQRVTGQRIADKVGVSCAACNGLSAAAQLNTWEYLNIRTAGGGAEMLSLHPIDHRDNRALANDSFTCSFSAYYRAALMKHPGNLRPQRQRLK